MKRLVLLLALVACASEGGERADRAENVPARIAPDVDAALGPCAGRWIARHPKTIVHRGRDSVLEIARERGRWTIRIDVVFDPGIVQRGPTTYTRGETRALTARDGRLVFEQPLAPGGELREVAWTFHREGDLLLAPAWVRRDERTWEYSDASERFSIRTEHDPDVVATAGATLEGVPRADTPITYVASVRESLAVDGEDTFVVAFSQPEPSGGVRALGELCRRPRVGTWFVRHSMTTHGERWQRLPDAEWSAILALPRVDERPPR